jgi:hypothetical protein
MCSARTKSNETDQRRSSVLVSISAANPVLGFHGTYATVPFLRRSLPPLRSIVVLFLAASSANAREVRLPLTVSATMIRDALVEQVFTAPGKQALFWGEPGECSFFYLEDPVAETRDGVLSVRAHGEARLGTDFIGGCFSPLTWSGQLEALEKPRLDGWSLLFEVVDSHVYDERGEKASLTGRLWDRIKETVHPRLEAVRIDLAEPFQELRAMLPLLLSADEEAAVRGTLDTLRPVATAVTEHGVTVLASLEVPDAPVAVAPPAPEAPLTEPEIEAFTQHLNQWDAFVTFVVKELGQRTLREETRQALLATLLEARYEILQALGAPKRSEDPVRSLFVSIWGTLRPLAEEIARELPGAEAVRLVTFLAAGDALVAFDEIGPTFGVEVSADGLRRLARMVGPEAPEDPLDYTPYVDPKLRFFLGFGSPLEEPPPPDSGWTWPTRVFAAASNVSRWTGWLFSDRSEVDAYLTKIAKLISQTSSKTIDAQKLGGTRAVLMERLMPATAWQESCWRQFLRRAGTVTYIRSSQGSVGILQINERVWRGFYDVDDLRWEIAYNARAGSEILARYLSMALARSDEPSEAKIPSVARSVYAAYNGGPGQLRRYRSGKAPKGLLRVIDGLFGAKFDTPAGEMTAKVARCLVGG